MDKAYYDNGINKNIEGAKYNRMYVELIPMLACCFNLSPNDILIFHYLFQLWCSENYNRNNDFIPVSIMSITTFAKLLQLDRRTFSKSLKKLSNKELITIERDGHKRFIQCNKQKIDEAIEKRIKKMYNKSPPRVH